MGAEESYGSVVRQKRESLKIGLREMARLIGVSPTYQSKVERDEIPPPAEDKVKRTAEVLRCDADQLLALAGRVSSELTEIIKRQPSQFATLLRTTKGFSSQRIERLINEAKKAKDKM